MQYVEMYVAPAPGIRDPIEDSSRDLIPALNRLDERLCHAVALADAVYGADAASDRFRGLYMSRADAARLLDRTPGAPLLPTIADSPLPAESTRLSRLIRLHRLDPLSADALLLSVAPEVDLKYERLYAYLQDDVTRKRPTLDLILNLLCASVEEKLAARSLFAPDAPLVRNALVQGMGDSDLASLSHAIQVDEQVLLWLLNGRVLDSALIQFCSRDTVDEAPPCLWPDVERLAETSRPDPIRAYLQGPVGAGKRTAAAWLARGLGRPLLTVDLAAVAEPTVARRTLAIRICRAAALTGALVYVTGFRLGDEPMAGELWRVLLRELGSLELPVLFGGERNWPRPADGPSGVQTIWLGSLPVKSRRACWADNLARRGVHVDSETLDTVAERFRLRPAQIADAAALASRDSQCGLEDLSAAARQQSGHELAGLARKITPVYRWSDIVLPDDSLAQLREISARARLGGRVLGDWGFGRRMGGGKGVNALFAGPSGTGKTMAAEIVAADLGFDLYRIDLAGVVSKYIGETEKNLNRVFAAAEDANAILFFDEADALFGKRSEVRDSHDRYANVEISYLLQKMEDYEGVSILATNLRQNLDEAFVRRIAFTVHFPFPSEADRLRVWRGIWPPETPLGEDVDLPYLAGRFTLSGGNIKNVALAAAFLAAERDEAVAMRHLLAAVRREYQKLGKALTDAEIGSPSNGKAAAAVGATP